ncbi:LysM peptidoglycan-binding domain-containing protein [Streptomyces griseoluteus]|uniref:LysM peptidoglycan-binding domain-containing protein n=1 Tax=Streptomyces griseoluteus TaxID=29306 RepID=A0A4Z1DH08_STRGP|nr:transglycosylase family protein [Streptomyces griseoluteus]TGN82928.1 LysM peptidoglycan-binding domain-containing protein [Streptomyces griseoluteus]GHF16481.1 peptidoglycan-binding protein LysM [Streptomyces griseoluteus]
MLSGNGRHRRPRQAPALLVAAGVTTSAIAIPLLGAASANAADGTTWDKVAECESGGSWSADTGNGYYGGLQISQDDWDKYGGTQYAASADQASRSQQISVAEKILADQGTTHWATCALLAGLTSNSGSVDVDTGVSESPSAGQGAPGKDAGKSSETPEASASSDGSGSSGLGNSSPSSDSSGSSGKETGKPSSSASEKGTAGDAKKDTGASRSDASAPPAAGHGYQDGGSPSSAPAAEDDESWEDGGSWSLVDTGDLGGGRHRGGSADESVTEGQHTAGTGRHATSPSTYTVRDGDTLGSIADSLDVDGGWEALYSANKQALGADPNHVDPGQTLKVPGE